LSRLGKLTSVRDRQADRHCRSKCRACELHVRCAAKNRCWGGRYDSIYRYWADTLIMTVCRSILTVCKRCQLLLYKTRFYRVSEEKPCLAWRHSRSHVSYGRPGPVVLHATAVRSLPRCSI